MPRSLHLHIRTHNGELDYYRCEVWNYFPSTKLEEVIEVISYSDLADLIEELADINHVVIKTSLPTSEDYRGIHEAAGDIEVTSTAG
jgi:hypothetical protein